MGCLTSKPQRKRYWRIGSKDIMGREPSGHQTFDGADTMEWVHTNFTEAPLPAVLEAAPASAAADHLGPENENLPEAPDLPGEDRSPAFVAVNHPERRYQGPQIHYSPSAVQYRSNPDSPDIGRETLTNSEQPAEADSMIVDGTSSSPATAPPPTPAEPPTLRLARLSDLPRISLVATAGHSQSHPFQFQRPFFNAYPDTAFPLDSVAAQRTKYRDAILDPKRAVVVVEAALDSDESVRVSRSLRRAYPRLDDDHYPKNPAGKRGIVGVASWCFPDGSRRLGDFMPDGSPTTGLANFGPFENHERDVSSEGKAMYKLCLSGSKDRWLRPSIRVVMAVHPAYWRHEHGRMLMQWGLDIADRDSVRAGASAGENGKKFLESMGFVMVEEVTLAGYKDHEDEITVGIAVREPQGGQVGLADGEGSSRGRDSGNGEGSSGGSGSARGRRSNRGGSGRREGSSRGAGTGQAGGSANGQGSSHGGSSRQVGNSGQAESARHGARLPPLKKFPTPRPRKAARSDRNGQRME